MIWQQSRPLNSTWHFHGEECLALELCRTDGATQSGGCEQWRRWQRLCTFKDQHISQNMRPWNIEQNQMRNVMGINSTRIQMTLKLEVGMNEFKFRLVVVVPRHHVTLTCLSLFSDLSFYTSRSTWMAFSNFRLPPHWCHYTSVKGSLFLTSTLLWPCSAGHVRRVSLLQLCTHPHIRWDWKRICQTW